MTELSNKNNVPLIPLRGLSILPYEVIHFDVGREKSIRALEEAMMNDQLIFLVSQKDVRVEKPKSEDLYEYGVVCRVKQMLKLPGDAIRVLVEGKHRGKIEEFVSDEPYFEVDIEEYFNDFVEKNNELEALMRSILDTFEDYVSVNSRITPEILISVSSIENPERFADIVASNINLKLDKKMPTLQQALNPTER